MSLLRSKVCIVTGAGQGIGLGIAQEMAREGASVVMLDRNAAVLKDAAGQIRNAGGLAEDFLLDVTDYDAYARIIADVMARHGKIDVLVNNAAINAVTKTILNDTLEDWRHLLSINLEAVYMGSKLVVPHMVTQGSGRVIHLASVQGYASSGNCGPYNAAKGAIIGYTKSMAVELGAHGILVNAVAPGFIKTPMSMVDGVDETETPEFVDLYLKRGRIPLRRVGIPEDIAGTVVFLASDYCRYMTGQVLTVDGGMMSTF